MLPATNANLLLPIATETTSEELVNGFRYKRHTETGCHLPPTQVNEIFIPLYNLYVDELGKTGFSTAPRNLSNWAFTPTPLTPITLPVALIDRIAELATRRLALEKQEAELKTNQDFTALFKNELTTLLPISSLSKNDHCKVLNSHDFKTVIILHPTRANRWVISITDFKDATFTLILQEGTDKKSRSLYLLRGNAQSSERNEVVYTHNLIIDIKNLAQRQNQPLSLYIAKELNYTAHNSIPTPPLPFTNS